MPVALWLPSALFLSRIPYANQLPYLDLKLECISKLCSSTTDGHYDESKSVRHSCRLKPAVWVNSFSVTWWYDTSLYVCIHVGIVFCSTIHRRGGPLPEGVSVIGGKLVFGRALHMNDTGVYECVVKNSAGTSKAEYTLTVAGKGKWNIQGFGRKVESGF